MKPVNRYAKVQRLQRLNSECRLSTLQPVCQQRRPLNLPDQPQYGQSLLQRFSRAYEICAQKKPFSGSVEKELSAAMLIWKASFHSDGWKGYDGLTNIGYIKHYRVKHGANEFANCRNYFNGIESFWSFDKMRLTQFHGINKDKFLLHLRE